MESKTWPTLYKKTKTGKVQEWSIGVTETQHGSGCITVKHGLNSGKKVSTSKNITGGKNIGKANETTPIQQALSEAASAWTKKIDSGYTEDATGESHVLLPMLAHNYKDHAKKVNYPCYVQPKLDGVRCLAFLDADGEVMLMSRKGKPYHNNLKEQAQALKTVLRPGIILDGEIYKHGWTLQQIVRGCRKRDLNLSHALQFWLFDIITPDDLPYRERKQQLASLHKYMSKHMFKLVRTDVIAKESMVDACHDNAVSNGYEGLILRSPAGKYQLNTRSYDLLKYKKFFDMECTIIGAKQGTGTEAGCVVWICITDNNIEFESRPRGSFSLRRRWWRDRRNIIGKRLTVRYQGWTEDGKPTFNRGIIIRDYE